LGFAGGLCFHGEFQDARNARGEDGGAVSDRFDDGFARGVDAAPFVALHYIGDPSAFFDFVEIGHFLPFGIEQPVAFFINEAKSSIERCNGTQHGSRFGSDILKIFDTVPNRRNGELAFFVNEAPLAANPHGGESVLEGAGFLPGFAGEFGAVRPEEGKGAIFLGLDSESFMDFPHHGFCCLPDSQRGSVAADERPLAGVALFDPEKTVFSQGSVPVNSGRVFEMHGGSGRGVAEAPERGSIGVLAFHDAAFGVVIDILGVGHFLGDHRLSSGVDDAAAAIPPDADEAGPFGWIIFGERFDPFPFGLDEDFAIEGGEAIAGWPRVGEGLVEGGQFDGDIGHEGFSFGIDEVADIAVSAVAADMTDVPALDGNAVGQPEVFGWAGDLAFAGQGDRPEEPGPAAIRCFFPAADESFRETGGIVDVPPVPAAEIHAFGNREGKGSAVGIEELPTGFGVLVFHGDEAFVDFADHVPCGFDDGFSLFVDEAPFLARADGEEALGEFSGLVPISWRIFISPHFVPGAGFEGGFTGFADDDGFGSGVGEEDAGVAGGHGFPFGGDEELAVESHGTPLAIPDG